MKIIALLLAASAIASCTARPAATGGPGAAGGGRSGFTALPSTRSLVDLHERHVEPAIETRRFTHDLLWSAIGPVIDGSPVLRRNVVGRSAEGREIYTVTYGTGPTRVLLWSQMHGDESTATMALADIFRFLAAEPDHPLAVRLRERLTIVWIPMLNPDGAGRFQRRNAYGVDVNRDARSLATPEARTLKRVQETFDPHFGFNLHDQNVRTRVGDSERLAAIALLAPAFDEARSMNEVRARAVKVAAIVREAVEPLVPGHVSRYGDAFNPRAFGDLMQTWGVSTVLIESGGWRDDPEKQHLRRANFVGLLTALDAIATGAYESADPDAYHSLARNGPAVNDVLVRGGTVVVPGLEPARVDISIDFEDALARTGSRVDDVGDLSHVSARDTIEAAGLFIHPEAAMTTRSAGRPILAPGAEASFTLRRRPDPRSPIVMRLVDGVSEAIPDRQTKTIDQPPSRSYVPL
jgi:hypothetical protein